MRPRRVPDELARLVFERLERSGDMAIVLAVLEDHADELDYRLRQCLAAELLESPVEKAKFQARQGALSETQTILRKFRTLARRVPAEKPPEATNGRRRRPNAGPRVPT